MKKILALLLAVMMLAALLAGCGGTNAASVEEESKPASSSSSGSSAAAADAPEVEADEEGKFTRFEEPQEIKVLLRVWADWEGRKEVYEEINKIAEEKLNVHMNIECIANDFSTQIALMLAAGEVVDLCMVPWNFADMTGQNMLLPLNDYLDEYAPWIVENCSQYLPANTLDGQILAVPTLRMYNTSQYLIMRQDILEYLGLYDEAMALHSWSGLEELLLKVRDAQPDLPEELRTPAIFGHQLGQGCMIAFQGLDWSADEWADDYAVDYLGYDYLFVDPKTNEVSDNTFNPGMIAIYDRMYKWYHEGLISKDAATTQEYPDTCMANGQFFCYFSNAEYGAATAKSNNTGRPLCAIEVVNIGLTTAYVNCYGWGIPSTCENPEAAVAALNLFFEDEDVANLMVWGIRGRDYELDDEGCAYRLEGHSYEALEYFQGNQFHAYAPQQPEGSAYRQNQWNDNINGYISPFFGLVIDNSEIANEMTAVKNVHDKYYPTIACGQVEAGPILEEYKAEVMAAGMDKILAFYQAAVDDWIASH